MMRRLLIPLLLASAAFAQKPPKAVDEALRARVNEFYQYHVTEEYRKAEKLVAEESQDIYYTREKPKYESFEIKTIEYRDPKFTKARVTVTVGQYGHAQGFTGIVMKTPSISYWKIVDGKWMWYVDPEELKRVGFGPSANAGTKPPPGAEPPKVSIPADTDMALGKVLTDKGSIDVKAGCADQVTITNTSAGTVGLAVYQVLPDIKVTLDKKSLNRGEKAVATIKCGENPHQGEIQFQVTPTNEVLSVQTKRR